GGEVHLPALAAGAAGRLAPDLGADRLQRGALGEQVPDGAVRTEDDVIDPQGSADTDGHRLLPLALVQRAGNLAFQEQEIKVILIASDEHHPAVHIKELRWGERGVGAHGTASILLLHAGSVATSPKRQRGDNPTQAPSASAGAACPVASAPGLCGSSPRWRWRSRA